VSSAAYAACAVLESNEERPHAERGLSHQSCQYLRGINKAVLDSLAPVDPPDGYGSMSESR
jgi:hypothetical protein